VGGAGVVVTGCAANVAVMAVSALMVTMQAAVPLHAPDQPENVWPDAGVAVSTTEVPSAKAMLQTWPQSIPAGLDLIEPEPLSVTVNIAVELAGGPPLPVFPGSPVDDEDPPQATAASKMNAAPKMRCMSCCPLRSTQTEGVVRA
jgi:hypothetical protein